VSVLWFIAGYSLAFGDSVNGWIGGLDKAFLGDIVTTTLKEDIPETVFFMFQMTFAIITPGLIVGAYPERVRFGAVLMFSALWLLLVYVPICHWVWGGGWMAAMGVMDFAGGIVVHTSAGLSALVFAHVLGGRHGFPHEVALPHNPGMTMAGAAMLWVGWYGFNGGSALAANGNAGMAITVTHIAAAAGALAWMSVEWLQHRKASLVGIVTGTIAGLATITPAAGFIGPEGALPIGIAGGIVCYYATALIKRRWHIDDTLDVFAVHGVGGMLGTLLTAFFAAKAFGGAGFASANSISAQFLTQLTGVAVAALWSVVLTFAILKAVEMFVGLRVSQDQEAEGLDVTQHGERAYDM
jgi:Amt family ammonium transporter